MQVSTLNKIINLFIVGSFTLLVLFVFRFQTITTYLKSSDFKSIIDSVSPALATFISTSFILAGVVFGGLLVESMASILRSFLRVIYNNRLLVAFLRCKNQVENAEFYRNKFIEIYKASSKYKKILGSDEQNRLAAIAILFHTAKSENIDWGVQHYSVYLLATNYFLISLISLLLVLLGDFSRNFKTIFFVSILSICYLLLHTIIDKYFFVYENVFRHACVVMCNEDSSLTDSHLIVL